MIWPGVPECILFHFGLSEARPSHVEIRGVLAKSTEAVLLKDRTVSLMWSALLIWIRILYCGTSTYLHRVMKMEEWKLLCYETGSILLTINYNFTDLFYCSAWMVNSHTRHNWGRQIYIMKTITVTAVMFYSQKGGSILDTFFFNYLTGSFE